MQSFAALSLLAFLPILVIGALLLLAISQGIIRIPGLGLQSALQAGNPDRPESIPTMLATEPGGDLMPDMVGGFREDRR